MNISFIYNTHTREYKSDTYFNEEWSTVIQWNLLKTEPVQCIHGDKIKNF